MISEVWQLNPTFRGSEMVQRNGGNKSLFRRDLKKNRNTIAVKMSREISHSWGRYRIIGKICFSLFSCIGLYIDRTDLIKMNQSITKKYKGTTSQLVWLNIQIHTGSSILEHLSLHIINGSAFSQVERKAAKNYGTSVCHSVVPFLLKNLWYWNSTGLEY